MTGTSHRASEAHKRRHKLAQNPEQWADYVKTLGPERTDALEQARAQYEAYKRAL